MSRPFVAAAAVLGALLVYAALGTLVAPRLIERYLPERAEAMLGRPVSVGRVRVNPFTFAVRARDLRIGSRGRPAPVEIGALTVDFDPLSSGFGRGWAFGEVRIADARIRGELDRSGRLDLAQLVPGGSAGASAGGGAPPRIVLRHVLIEAAAELRVLSGGKPETLDAGPVRVEAFDVATRPDREGRYTVSARLADGASIAWRGDLALAPVRSEGEIEVKALELGTLWPLLRAKLDLPEPRGAVDASARYRFAADGGALALDAVRVSARDLALPARSGPPLLAARSLAIEGGRLDLAKREISAERVSLDHGALRVARDENGKLQLPALPQGEPAAKEKPWTYRVQSARASAFELALSDRGFSPALAVALEDVAIEARNLASDSKTPVELEARGRIAAGGSFSLRGSAPRDFARARADVELRDAALAPFAPLVERFAAVKLVSGNASVDAHVEYHGAGAHPALEASGSASLAGVEVRDAATGERVLAWRSAEADEARVTAGPVAIAAKQIVVDGADARIAISRERKLNLAQLIKTGEAAPPADEAGPAATVRVGAVRVRRSRVDFSDQSLVLPFSARVAALHGEITGLSTAPGRRATLALEGRIGKFGAASAKGRLDVGAPRRFTDIAVAFENVDMPPLSPYSATFLGRKIAGGELWLDLDYRVVRGEMQGRNRVTVRDLALGERVDAPNALDVPIDLLVGLLTDSEGRLRVDVPVTGDVNDPRFDLGAVIRAQAGDFVRRIVSAPFRALAGLIRGKDGQSELKAVEFDAGSARLEPPEREKLQDVAHALAERPQLALVVPGPYDPERDAAALKDELVRRELAQRLGRPAAPGEDPGPVAFGSPATQRALEGMAEERLGRDAMRTLAGWFAADQGHDPQRVSLLRRPGDPRFYRAVYARLVSGQALAPDAAKSLASRRAQAVIGYLRSAGADPARLAAGEMQLAHGEGDAVPAELALQAAGAPAG